MKLKLTVAAFLLSAGSAFAGCYTPELELSLDHDSGYTTNDYFNDSHSYTNGNNRNDNGLRFGITLNIPLGKAVKDLCAAEIREINSDIDKNIASIKETRAQERDKNADARAQELDNLEQRIEICSEFDKSTAPNSIIKFCGDLLQ